MMRKNIDAGEARTEVIRFMVSKQEREVIEKAAKKLGLSLSSYIRLMVIGAALEEKWGGNEKC